MAESLWLQNIEYYCYAHCSEATQCLGLAQGYSQVDFQVSSANLTTLPCHGGVAPMSLNKRSVQAWCAKHPHHPLIPSDQVGLGPIG